MYTMVLLDGVAGGYPNPHWDVAILNLRAADGTGVADLAAQYPSEVPEAPRLTRVWLPVHLLAEMAVAADVWAPLEAGGVLAGYWSTEYSEAVVTHVIGAGPRAEHRTDGMTPDADYQESELDPSGTKTRSCRLHVLVDEPTEEISPFDVGHAVGRFDGSETLGYPKI